MFHLRDDQVGGPTFHLYPSFPEKKKVKLIYESPVIEGSEENTPGSRLDFRGSFRGRSAGSFPEQRLVIEPTQDLSEKYLW